MRFINLVLSISAFILLNGCTTSELLDYTRAQNEMEKGNFRIALSYLERVIAKAGTEEIGLSATRDAAKITFFEIKDFKKSEQFYKKLVLHSHDEKERREAQKQIASIYFDHLNDYKMAVIEFSRLLEMPHNAMEEVQYRTSIARAYYYQNNFFQAQSEVDELLSKKPQQEYRFNLLLLKANIYTATKNIDSAIMLLEGLMREFPELSIKENVGLTLTVSYEENKDYPNAIRVLQTIKPHYPNSEYIDIRINRLNERQKNAPGAKGLRK